MYSAPASTVVVQNSVFDRAELALYQFTPSGTALIPIPISLRNNLLWNANLILTNANGSGTAGGDVMDNAFDNSSLALNPTHVTLANNAYIYPSSPPNFGEAVKTNFTSFAYTNGPLGSWYQVTASLVNLGQQSAPNAGLYHYTTQTSLAKEAATQVDIGFHYVATINGLPTDTDGDGIPDYFEDRNGNGSLDTGETDWQVSNTLGAGANQLTLFTPLQ